MRSAIATLLYALLALSACAAPDPTSIAVDHTAAIGGSVTRVYLVQLKQDSDPSAVAASIPVSPRFLYRHALKGFAAELPDAAIAALSRNPNVLRIEPDGPVSISDAQLSPVWNLDRIDQRTLPLSGSYSYHANGSGVTVYIIDTGLRSTHVDFGGRVRPGFTAILDGRGTSDCNGHGTHVAGTVGGQTYGVAKAVLLVPVRVLNCGGSGTYSEVIAGVDYVTGQIARPAVANMSLGGDVSAILNAAVEASIASGISYAVAAGNAGADACLFSPASVFMALTVGATDINDQLASFSNRGGCVDLLAPGVGVQSAYNCGDSCTAVLSGTSMATPHVAGAAALYLETAPSASPALVWDALRATTTDGIVAGVPNGTPNRLLYTALFIRDGPAPPQPPPIPNQPPVAAIIYPPAPWGIYAGDLMTFIGTASDFEQATVPDTAMVWSSNLQGRIGIGREFVTSALIVGEHVVSLVARDFQGLADTAQVGVFVFPNPNPPPPPPPPPPDTVTPPPPPPPPPCIPRGKSGKCK